MEGEETESCEACRNGRHANCFDALCNCIADHPGDEAMMRGFKRLKRVLHPEREAHIKGGWGLTK